MGLPRVRFGAAMSCLIPSCTRRRIASTRNVVCSPAKPKAGRRTGCRCGSTTPPTKSRRASFCLGEAPIRPGEAAYIQLVLNRPTAAAVRRPLCAARYVGLAHDRRRTLSRSARAGAQAPHTRAPCATPRARVRGYRGKSLAGLVGRRPRYVDLAEFARDRALSMERRYLLVERLGTVRVSGSAATYAFLERSWVRLKQDLLTALGAFHAANPDKARH